MAETTEKKEKKQIKKVAKEGDVAINVENSKIARKVLIEPWVTEKSHAGITDNKYTFRIAGNATKAQVKAGIEGIYKVKIEKINVVNLKPKWRSYGRHGGRKSAVRKATVTLKKGDKIELFRGA